MSNLSIYIHYPFCERKCPYCGFFSKAETPEQNIAEYLQELDFYHTLTADRTVDTIFFGGGTPSLLAPLNIAKIINHIHKKWKTTKDIEISLEANPNSLKAEELKSAGINRLSLGVQSLDDNELKFLGRIHNCASAIKAIEETLKNFDNHNADIIYALPGQTTQILQKKLTELCSFGFKHLSIYQLTIDENTVFKQQGIKPLEEDQASDFYTFTAAYLAKHGYPQYEVSNFGLPCRHNLTYWRGGDYLGIGKGAHGRVGLKATSYNCQIENLSKKERATELLLMGLRIVEGINKETFYKICNIELDSFINQNKLKEYEKMELLKSSINSLKATPKGLLVLDCLIEGLL